MPPNTNPSPSFITKHHRGFWPIMIILVVGVLFVAGILFAVNSSNIQADVDSITFFNHTVHLKPYNKAPVKTPVSTTTPTKAGY